jgi:pentatricopeptide repeat protein
MYGNEGLMHPMGHDSDPPQGEAVPMPNALIEANKRIQALGAARRLDAALSEFHGLKKSGLKASLVTYNVILYACVRCGAVDQALEIFASQRSLAATIPALAPNIVTYTTVMKGLCQSGRVREAWRLLKEAANLVELNSRAVNMFLRGCLWHGYPSEALECYGSLAKWAVVPDRVTVDYTVRLLSFALRITEASSLLTSLPRHVTVRVV